MKKQGISVIEMIIIISIALILTLIGVGVFSKFRDTQTLNGTIEETVSLLSEARSKTLASADFSQYGIHFESNRAVLFKGEVFSESDPANKEIKFSPFIEAYSISLNGGGSDAVFQKLTGKTGQYGNIAFRAKKNPAETKTIIIESTGIINIQ